jgi:hypothetical protein
MYVVFVTFERGRKINRTEITFPIASIQTRLYILTQLTLYPSLNYVHYYYSKVDSRIWAIRFLDAWTKWERVWMSLNKALNRFWIKPAWIERSCRRLNHSSSSEPRLLLLRFYPLNHHRSKHRLISRLPDVIPRLKSKNA